MYNLSEFIGKEAIILSNGQSGGTVSNVFFDARLKLFKFAELVHDEDETEDGKSSGNRKMVAFRGITSIGEAVVIRSDANIIGAAYDNLSPAPMNLPCFNQDGKNMGIVRDIVMDTNKIIIYQTDMMDIEANTLLVASNDLLIFNDTGVIIKKPPNKKVEHIRQSGKTQNPKHKTQSIVPMDELDADVRLGHYEKTIVLPPLFHDEKPTSLDTDYVPPSNHTTDEFYQSLNDTQDTTQIKTPNKITEENTTVVRSPIKDYTKNKYDFLIGMQLVKDIYNSSGHLILKKGVTISSEQINLAKAHDRLVSMTLNCI